MLKFCSHPECEASVFFLTHEIPQVVQVYRGLSSILALFGLFPWLFQCDRFVPTLVPFHKFS